MDSIALYLVHMPYKDPAKRRAYLKKKRKNPEYRAKLNTYFREYAKKWRRRHLDRLREYQRAWKARWRKKHPRKARAYNREWRRGNPGKVHRMHQRWYAKHGHKWYQRNRIKLRERAKRQYRKERRFKIEQQKARRRRYYWKNRERINKRRKTQWAKNPVPFRVREWVRYRKHRLARIVSQRNIQARRAGAKGRITPEQWRRLLRRHHFLCFYCGAKLVPTNRTLDHKLPLSRGGTNTIDNVVPACRPCNQRKMRLTAGEFLAELRRGPRKFQ